MHLAALHSRQRSTGAALSAATTQHQAFLKGLQPVSLQHSALATHAARATIKPAALQPPAPAPYAARSTSQLATWRPPAPAAHAAHAAPQPAAMSLWLRPHKRLVSHHKPFAWQPLTPGPLAAPAATNPAAAPSSSAAWCPAQPLPPPPLKSISSQIYDSPNYTKKTPCSHAKMTSIP